ncbi:MAG: hypothetical protein KatS3mg090_0097 [Patescibacteria group bacterium]|nr:MAG: hypothetical protein KatS3mg090_0097 [Patescibacteria group bacterium]
MKISVIIPAYNEEKYIEATLKSLTKQTKKPFEIIVVDNNCTDRTAEIAKKYNCKVIKETRQGITPARNKGFSSAQGDIFVKLDADTIVDKDFLEKIEQRFKNDQSLVLLGFLISYDLKKINTVRLYQIFYKTLSSIFGFNVGSTSYAINSKFWQRILPKTCLDDKKVHEDFDIFFHTAELGGKAEIAEEIIINSSARRIIKKPHSFFIEYNIRLLKMINSHKQILKNNKGIFKS